MKRVELGEVCNKASSNYAQKDLDKLEGEFPVYGAGGFIKNINTYHQDKDYVAVVKDGAGVGRVMFLPARSSVIGTLQYLLPKDDLHPKYLYYAVRHMHLEKYYTGATIPHIYFRDYQKTEFNLPDMSIQLDIINVLEKTEDILMKRTTQLTELDTLIKVRFIEMFGDPVKNTFGWETRKLDEICNGIGDGLHGTPVYDGGGEFPFINGNNLIDGKIVITDSTKHVGIGEYNRLHIDISPNAVLISINGTLGKTALYHGEKVVLGKSACYCNLKDSINRSFIYGIMRSDSFGKYLDSVSTKSTIKNVGLKEMREFKVIMPPTDLQEEFEYFTAQVEKSKQAVKKSLEETQFLLDSLLQKYFG